MKRFFTLCLVEEFASKTCVPRQRMKPFLDSGARGRCLEDLRPAPADETWSIESTFTHIASKTCVPRQRMKLGLQPVLVVRLEDLRPAPADETVVMISQTSWEIRPRRPASRASG